MDREASAVQWATWSLQRLLAPDWGGLQMWMTMQRACISDVRHGHWDYGMRVVWGLSLVARVRCGAAWHEQLAVLGVTVSALQPWHRVGAFFFLVCVWSHND